MQDGADTAGPPGHMPGPAAELPIIRQTILHPTDFDASRKSRLNPG